MYDPIATAERGSVLLCPSTKVQPAGTCFVASAGTAEQMGAAELVQHLVFLKHNLPELNVIFNSAFRALIEPL